MNLRVVFDSSTVVSALLFPKGRLAWLRGHWRDRECLPLASAITAAELSRVLAYPKFRLSAEERRELLADYLPCCTIVDVRDGCPVVCRDPRDQPFLDLAYTGAAQVLVTSDRDLLELAGRTAFAIRTPEAYRGSVRGV